MSGAPRVSVLLATRDGERFLEESLASLAAQTFTDFELIAVDDGSSDRSGALLERFAAGDARARVLRTPGVGLAAALALAAESARGEYFARQDDDDVSEPTRFERQVEYLDAHADTAVLGTAAMVIDEAGTTLGPYPVPLAPADIRRMLRRAPPFVHGAVMMRADAYRAAGGYRAAFRASQDYDLWLRLPAGAGLANLAEPLYRWRHHAGGVFARARDEQLWFAALAQALAFERARTGSDSLVAYEAGESREAFLEQSPLGPRLALLLGARYVREGRGGEARAFLARALRGGDTRVAALGWQALSYAVALTPRGRRARRAAKRREDRNAS